MRVIVFTFLLSWSVSSLLGQKQPHTVSIGGTFANDFDNFGWYSHKPIYVTQLGYTYTFRKSKNHLQFSLDVIEPSYDAKNVDIRFKLYEVYVKRIAMLNIQYKWTYFSSKYFELQTKSGIIGRYGSGSFDTYRDSYHKEIHYVPYDSFGASLGAEFLAQIPLGLTARLAADFAYYFYNPDPRRYSYGVYTPTSSLYLNIGVGYQFGGKKREKKQFE